jgi:hypothetical protein
MRPVENVHVPRASSFANRTARSAGIVEQGQDAIAALRQIKSAALRQIKSMTSGEKTVALTKFSHRLFLAEFGLSVCYIFTHYVGSHQCKSERRKCHRLQIRHGARSC